MTNPETAKHKLLGDYRLAVDRAMQSAERLAADLARAHQLQEQVKAHATAKGIKFPAAPATTAWPGQVDALIASAKAG